MKKPASQARAYTKLLRLHLIQSSGQQSPHGVLELASGLDVLEYATASAIVAIHPAGITQAEQAGLAAEMILAPDLRAIVEACRAARGREKSVALEGAVLALMRIGHWGQEWTPELLLDFARFRPDGPSANQWAAALVKVHERWAAVVEEYGPMYCPPVALGALMPVKIGLALARLARWSGVPLPWLHHGFTVACARRDARTAIREGRAA